MDSMNLLPVGESGWGNGGAAALGAFVGSWFGNGWGGRGGVAAADAAVVAAGSNQFETGLVVDGLSNIQSSINALGIAALNGQNNTNMAISSGLANTTSTLNGTMMQQLLASQAQTNGIQSTLCQGFSGVNQSVYQAGVDNRFAISDLGTQIAACCGETQRVIAAEGAATRGLINDRYINQLQTELCDAKAKIGSLQTEAFVAASQAAQTNQIVGTILQHLPHVK